MGSRCSGIYNNNQRTQQSLDRKTPYDWYEYAAYDLNINNIPSGLNIGSIKICY